MEMTKKEYISKLKKELDTIELRYQHLLNENAMIGEDFRSQALNNLHYAKSLEEEIDSYKDKIKVANEHKDNKEMELVVKERECESLMMFHEETLHYLNTYREERDHYSALSTTMTEKFNHS